MKKTRAHFPRIKTIAYEGPKSANPLAFRHYNPDLGDGRGFLYAQLREAGSDRLLDLGTKGSGRTPWSRTADGRLTLKGGVREVLAAVGDSVPAGTVLVELADA